MTEEARGEWLAVARKTVDHLPADLLAIGCKKARETCDHPSKIVPTILAEVSQMLKWRRKSARDTEQHETRRLEAKPCTPAEAERILDAEGIIDAVRGNLAKPFDRGPRRNPTRQDYIDMGVDPAVFDSIPDAHQPPGGV